MSIKTCLAMAIGLFLSSCAAMVPNAGKLAESSLDIVVAADGSGAFKSIQAAIESIPENNAERKIVWVKNGVYNERVRISRDFVTLRGESREGVRIEARYPYPYNGDEDKIGRGIINVFGDDVVIENLAVSNTQPQTRTHAFTVFGRGTRTVILDCDLLSNGSDTVSLWQSRTGMYYQARCHMKGCVDFVCPRGWCYIRDSSFYQVATGVALWHDGSKNEDQKFVVVNGTFGAEKELSIGRYGHPAAFYLIDCVFAGNPVKDFRRPEKESYKGGHRVYFSHCRSKGDTPYWMRDNLSEAKGSPKPSDITAKWTFGGAWDPENEKGPTVVSLNDSGSSVSLVFSEPVTARGKPAFFLEKGRVAEYVSGSGGDTLAFKTRKASDDDKASPLGAIRGEIVASKAGAKIRRADLSGAIE